MGLDVLHCCLFSPLPIPPTPPKKCISERGGCAHCLGGGRRGAEVEQRPAAEDHPRRQPGGGLLRELQPGVTGAAVRQRQAHGAL